MVTSILISYIITQVVNNLLISGRAFPMVGTDNYLRGNKIYLTSNGLIEDLTNVLIGK